MDMPLPSSRAWIEVVTMEFKHQPTVTLAEVADAAGVGESTVSRVLRNTVRFQAGRDREMAAVERLGYVPNRIAGTLAFTASRLVASQCRLKDAGRASSLHRRVELLLPVAAI